MFWDDGNSSPVQVDFGKFDVTTLLADLAESCDFQAPTDFVEWQWLKRHGLRPRNDAAQALQKRLAAQGRVQQLHEDYQEPPRLYLPGWLHRTPDIAQ